LLFPACCRDIPDSKIALQNLQPVNTVVLLWRFTMPHVLLLAIMLGAGFVLGVTVFVMVGARYLSE
jgi:hypothetical protein